MHVLILANGEPPSKALLVQFAAEHALFIATDGAALTAVRLGVAPNIVSGDFDSLDLDAAQAALPDAEFVPTPDQNQTDLEKALGIALERGATQLTVAGAAGGRVDHTLGNFCLLLRWREKYPSLPVTFVEDGSEVRAVTGEIMLETEPGDAVSLLSYDGRATVSIDGVRWPCISIRWRWGWGLLNEATESQVKIQSVGGVILACHLQSWRRRHS